MELRLYKNDHITQLKRHEINVLNPLINNCKPTQILQLIPNNLPHQDWDWKVTQRITSQKKTLVGQNKISSL